MKWGIKDKENVIIKPLYDTIFDFDSTQKVCLACFKSKSTSANRFIKTYTTTYACNYLNKQGNHLNIKTDNADTCTVFSLGKQTLKQYNNHSNYFIVSSKGKKYLIKKDFKQLLNKGYHEIYTTQEPKFIITEIKNDDGNVFTGLIDSNDQIVIPYSYSGIKINTKDSLIVGCSAGMIGTGNDDIYDYSGEKIASYRRHLDIATKNYVIHKIFEPKEYHILVNTKTKEETIFNADEIIPYEKDELLIKIKNTWYIFNLALKEKRAYNPINIK